MILKDTEYSIGTLPTKAGFADAIVISRKALEEWRDHYRKIEISEGHPSRQYMVGFYLGKADVLTEILKHFEED